MHLVLHLEVLHKLEVHEHANGGMGSLSIGQIKVTEAEV